MYVRLWVFCPVEQCLSLFFNLRTTLEKKNPDGWCRFSGKSVSCNKDHAELDASDNCHKLFLIEKHTQVSHKLNLYRFLASVRLAANRLNVVHSFCATISQEPRRSEEWRLQPNVPLVVASTFHRELLEGGMAWTSTAAGFTLLQLGRNKSARYWSCSSTTYSHAQAITKFFVKISRYAGESDHVARMCVLVMEEV